MSTDRPQDRARRTPAVDRIRTQSAARPNRRAALEQERDRLLTALDELDTELAERTRRRCQLLERLGELREALWPTARYGRGRRPAPTGTSDLPPLPDAPTWLAGRRLRSVCLALLRRAGRLTLRNLHAMLHAHGYGIESDHPVKALSDALAYETESGRARRVGRGVYEVAGPRPRAGRHGAPDLAAPADVPEDRLLDEVLAPAP